LGNFGKRNTFMDKIKTCIHNTQATKLNNLFYLNFLKKKRTPCVCITEHSNSKIVKDPNASLTKFNLNKKRTGKKLTIAIS